MKKLDREELIDGLRELVRRAHASGVDRRPSHDELKAMEGRSGRDERDVAHLLALNGCTNAEEAETILDRFFPGDALNDRAYGVLLAIFETGLPMVPETPAHIDLH